MGARTLVASPEFNDPSGRVFDACVYAYGLVVAPVSESAEHRELQIVKKTYEDAALFGVLFVSNIRRQPRNAVLADVHNSVVRALMAKPDCSPDDIERLKARIVKPGEVGSVLRDEKRDKFGRYMKTHINNLVLVLTPDEQAEHGQATCSYGDDTIAVQDRAQLIAGAIKDPFDAGGGPRLQRIIEHI